VHGIEELCRRSGRTPLLTRAGVVRCILEGLAPAYRRNVRLVGDLTGRPVEVVHIVGGGVRNELRCGHAPARPGT
jgi:rhamnulokinase